MNNKALKSFAVHARIELIDKVKARALRMGITEESSKKDQVEATNPIDLDGKQLSALERKQHEKLMVQIKDKGFSPVVKEVAYTWFSRFTALRYMEVNSYLPIKVMHELKINNKTEKQLKDLVIKQCNRLNEILPFMFAPKDDYTELLFPEELLGKASFICELMDIEKIPVSAWQKVEIMGWLYQYYISDEKARVFKAKKKFKAEDIPFATQLFTPEWIVRYMVQNSLGRHWIESHSEHRDLMDNWDFYLEDSNQENNFNEQLAPYINKELQVEDIKCFDPAMGSGHILVYMFDVLYEIYSKCGFVEAEIPKLIIENNLFGLDIDDRACQLACFSIIMKARQYNKRFLRNIENEGLTIHLAAIQQSNCLTYQDIAYIAGEESGTNSELAKGFLEQFKDAKTIGSLIKVNTYPYEFLANRLQIIKDQPVNDLFLIETKEKLIILLSQLIKQANIMCKQYDVLVTNPPYMGWKNMNAILSVFLSEYYPDSKEDLFAAFMEMDHYLKKSSFYACINQHSWMFLSSFEKLRAKVIRHKFIDTMLHLGPRVFEEIGGEVVQSTAFVLRNIRLQGVTGIYLRLINEKTSKEKQNKTLEAVHNKDVNYRYAVNSNIFEKIPNSPIGYWLSESVISVFFNSKPLSEYGNTGKGIGTGDNSKFLRYWHEIEKHKFTAFTTTNRKWFPYNKGGNYRKWYGNNEYVINWEDDGREVKGSPNSYVRNSRFFLKPGLTWTKVTSSKFSIRKFDFGFLFDDGGCCFFTDQDELYDYFLALMNSKVFYITGELSPTLNFQSGDVGRFPVILGTANELETINELARMNIQIAKTAWNCYETSWEFTTHPVFTYRNGSSFISECLANWAVSYQQQIDSLRANEEELNRLFLDIYTIQDIMTPDVSEEELTIGKWEKGKAVRSFISYAIGCCFGRYSLAVEGLAYAGGKYDAEKYPRAGADNDNILLILSDEFLEDDIVSRFIEFVNAAFGKEALVENLDFIANSLGKKARETSKEAIRKYFFNRFFKDHKQLYKNKPIYWLFTSGKQKAFNCLIYMHRYDKSTLSRIRTDYLHELRARLDAEKKSLLIIIDSDETTIEISYANKELKSLDLKLEELRAYDGLLHPMADMQIDIDLDDGISVNYAKFKGLLAPIV